MLEFIHSEGKVDDGFSGLIRIYMRKIPSVNTNSLSWREKKNRNESILFLWFSPILQITHVHGAEHVKDGNLVKLSRKYISITMTNI